MGKKSRLKRERRTDPSNVLARMMDERSGGARDHDVDFQHRETQLCELFSQYDAEDVALALGVSDLWLPNISAQVKHHFALGVFVSMNADRFTPSNGLNTYAAFCEFIGSVHALLPSFPSLEDFTSTRVPVDESNPACT